ncbi:hypothetical protein ACH5RR_009226 [Cinchona calisaya]|uniref:Replication factor A C-terminal domain-containing protein n=1 Tax=Cinchona calisaya TaxID=153742 RepID=A0ABD3ADT1_9GENT
MKAYMDSDKLLPHLVEDDIISIQKALESSVWVRAKTTFVTSQQKLSCAACKNFHKAVNTDIVWEIRCPSCKEDTEVEVRCKISIMLEDGTSSYHDVMFSLEAEKLIPFTALQLKDADENGQTSTDANRIRETDGSMPQRNEK